MHDLLNDLAKYVCGDICFRLEDDQVTNIPKTTRHFSVASNHVKCFDGFRTLYNAERLRTFMPSSEEMSFHNYNWWHCMMSTDELFSKFKFLRVLSLSGYSNLTEAPDSVGNLKYLHSLDLSHLLNFVDSSIAKFCVTLWLNSRKLLWSTWTFLIAYPLLASILCFWLHKGSI